VGPCRAGGAAVLEAPGQPSFPSQSWSTPSGAERRILRQPPPFSDHPSSAWPPCRRPSRATPPDRHANPAIVLAIGSARMGLGVAWIGRCLSFHRSPLRWRPSVLGPETAWDPLSAARRRHVQQGPHVQMHWRPEGRLLLRRLGRRLPCVERGLQGVGPLYARRDRLPARHDALLCPLERRPSALVAAAVAPPSSTAYLERGARRSERGSGSPVASMSFGRRALCALADGECGRFGSGAHVVSRSRRNRSEEK
jgi:hypothetical protein